MILVLRLQYERVRSKSDVCKQGAKIRKNMNMLQKSVQNAGSQCDVFYVCKQWVTAVKKVFAM